jgi:hypothetical protein
MENIENSEIPDGVTYYTWDDEILKQVCADGIATLYMLDENAEWTEEGVPNENIFTWEATAMSKEDFEELKSQITNL